MKRFMLICLCLLLMGGCNTAKPGDPAIEEPDDICEEPEDYYESLTEAAHALIEADTGPTWVGRAYYVMDGAGEQISVIAYTWTLLEQGDGEENWIEGCLRLEEDGSASYDENQIVLLPAENSPVAGGALLTVDAFEAMVAEIDFAGAFLQGYEEAVYYNLEYNVDESRQFAASGANPFAYYLIGEEGTAPTSRPDNFHSGTDELPGFHFFAAFPLDDRRRMLPEGFLVFLVPNN